MALFFTIMSKLVILTIYIGIGYADLSVNDDGNLVGDFKESLLV